MENNENKNDLKKPMKKQNTKEITKMKEVITKEAAINSDIVKEKRKDPN